MELVPAEIRHSTIVSSPQENFAGCTLCMYVVYSPSHPAAPSKMELAGFTFGYSRYFSRVPEFSEKEKKERKRERGERKKERGGKEDEKERKYRLPLAITVRRPC